MWATGFVLQSEGVGLLLHGVMDLLPVHPGLDQLDIS